MFVSFSEKKIEWLYFVRNDASKKEADGEANGAKEGDGQGYVLYWLLNCVTVSPARDKALNCMRYTLIQIGSPFHLLTIFDRDFNI